MFHEAAHTSLDVAHANTPEWREAQRADGGFISDYARDNPDREDIAESILPYFAVRFKPGRLSPGDRAKIEEAIPNRLGYFDAQRFDWSPYGPAVVPAIPLVGVFGLAALLIARWASTEGDPVDPALWGDHRGRRHTRQVPVGSCGGPRLAISRRRAAINVPAQAEGPVGVALWPLHQRPAVIRGGGLQ